MFYAEEQTAGVGQRNRRWASPPRVNIYATYVAPFPTESLALLAYVPQVVTIATAQTLESFGFAPKIKWVNDLHLSGKKVCGVLCENQGSFHDGLQSMLIGVGLNVNMEKEICDSLDQPVTSLSVEAAKEFDKEPIFQALTGALKENILKLIREKSFGGFLPYLNAHLSYIGEPILVIDREGEFKDDDAEHPDTKKGILVGINEHGHLLLQKEDDSVEEVITGRMRPVDFGKK